MNKSDQINDLAAALAKAQGAIKGAAKDSTNPHFRSQYADLASVWDACRAQLAQNGLSVVQCAGKLHDNMMEMTTMLLHSSGQWISSELSIPTSKVDAQGYGSACTYARRYALAAMVGVAADDDDGNAATGRNEKPSKEKQPPKQRKADNEKHSFQMIVAQVEPTRKVLNDNKAFAEFVIVGEMPDGETRQVFGYAPMADDDQWESDRFALAAANIGHRIQVFAHTGKSGQMVIDSVAEVSNG